jgi:polyisoprenoid-binding protein YceI
MTRIVSSTLALLAVAFAALADPAVDAVKSNIKAQFTQEKVPVEANFTRFSGSIAFDPAKPDQAHARLDIDTASFDIGDDDYNAEVRKPAWFDTAHFPKASFEATGLKPLGGGKFQAEGTLNLKGKTQALTVPVTVSSAGGASVFDGSVPVSRGYFAIGDAEWKDTVADQVLIKFHIVVPNSH